MTTRKASRKTSSPKANPDGDALPPQEPPEGTGEGDQSGIDSPSRRRLPPLLRVTWYSLNQAFRRRIHQLNVTPDQFTILRWLTECDPEWPTQRELGSMMASDPNTITSLLRRMENAGFVERQPHESDKRANRIKITPPGRKAYARARQIAVELQEEVLAALPDGKRSGFFELLEIIADSCRAALVRSGQREK
ncbi:MAG: MarR family winged helix-turn-helix transcriptional regulator [Phycisphaeraceae bacterium]